MKQIKYTEDDFEFQVEDFTAKARPEPKVVTLKSGQRRVVAGTSGKCIHGRALVVHNDPVMRGITYVAACATCDFEVARL